MISEPTVPEKHFAKMPLASFRSAIKNVRPHLLLLAVSTLALLPVMIYGIPKGADLFNHLRYASPFYDALASGNLHPGWLADSSYGLGDPRFSFYPPGLYYLLAAARFATGAWLPGLIGSFLVLTVVGGWGTYFWTRTAFDEKVAIWAGVLYIIAPYRLNELYQASLLAEYAACSILPFAFAFVERICRRKNTADIFGLAAAYALLILTHVPLAVIGSIALAIYALFRLERKGLVSTLKRLTLSVALGLAASSFFWTSVLAELPWIKGSAQDPNPYFDYRLNFVFSPSALTNRNTWYANVLAVVVLAFLLPGAIYVLRSWKKNESTRMVRATFLLLVITFLMATSLSRPVWAVVPKLAEIQFPWRWFAITTLPGTLLVAASLTEWWKQFRTNLRPRDLAVALGFALAIIFTATQIVWDCEYFRPANFESLVQEMRTAQSIKDWLPVWSRDFVQAYHANQADAGARGVTVTSWTPERRTFQLAAGSESTFQVRTYFYPHWTARAGGQVLPVTPTENGLIQIAVPAQATNVELVFQKPARARIAELISAATWLLIGAITLTALFGRTKKRPEATAEVAFS